MARKQIVLSLSHYIYLTKQDRYALHKGVRVEATGVSLPVWFYRGNTSEPATEVFCRYIIENKKEDDPIIYTIKDGYQFNLPQLPENFKRDQVPLDKWRSMSEEERSEWYTDNKIPLNSEFLLDPIDGGGKHLHWTQHNKRIKSEKMLMIKNYVEIKDVTDLEESLCF